MSKLHIKKGDIVFVNSGEYRGSTGRVLKVDTKKNRAIVEGVNFVTKRMKPNAKNPQGGMVRMEAGVHISNLNPIDPKTNAPIRINRKRDDKGRLVRFSKKSGEVLK